MRWFAAHVVMVVEIKEGGQDRFPAWENIILVEAPTEAEAFGKAERSGREGEGDDGGTFRWGTKPARWVFAGVRKLTECAPLDDRPGDGDEVSYIELEFGTRDDVKQFVDGKPTAALIDEGYREVGAAEPDSGKETGTRKRKHA